MYNTVHACICILFLFLYKNYAPAGIPYTFISFALSYLFDLTVLFFSILYLMAYDGLQYPARVLVCTL